MSLRLNRRLVGELRAGGSPGNEILAVVLRDLPQVNEAARGRFGTDTLLFSKIHSNLIDEEGS